MDQQRKTRHVVRLDEIYKKGHPAADADGLPIAKIMAVVFAFFAVGGITMWASLSGPVPEDVPIVTPGYQSVTLDLPPQSDPPQGATISREGRAPIEGTVRQIEGGTRIRADFLELGTHYTYRLHYSMGDTPERSFETKSVELVDVRIQLEQPDPHVVIVTSSPLSLDVRYTDGNGWTHDTTTVEGTIHRIPVEGRPPTEVRDLEASFTEGVVQVPFNPRKFIWDRVKSRLSSWETAPGLSLKGDEWAVLSQDLFWIFRGSGCQPQAQASLLSRIGQIQAGVGFDSGPYKVVPEALRPLIRTELPPLVKAGMERSRAVSPSDPIDISCDTGQLSGRSLSEVWDRLGRIPVTDPTTGYRSTWIAIGPLPPGPQFTMEWKWGNLIPVTYVVAERFTQSWVSFWSTFEILNQPTAGMKITVHDTGIDSQEAQWVWAFIPGSAGNAAMSDPGCLSESKDHSEQ